MPLAVPAHLRWPAAEGADRYQVTVRMAGRGKLLTLEVERPEALIQELPDVNSASVAGEAVLVGGEAVPVTGEGVPEWRVRILAGDGRWAPYLPFLEWPRVDEGPGAVLSWPLDGYLVHRVVVHDDTTGTTVLKVVTAEDGYTLAWSRLDPTHHYRWRVQRWQDGQWVEAKGYVPVVVPAEVRVVADSDAEHDAPARAPIIFLFTSDTESNLAFMRVPDFARAVEEHIWGRFPDGEGQGGIGLQMELLERHGFRGTFFVDVLAEYQFGEGSLQPVYDEILARGHDVELHLHPNPHLRFAADERIRALSTATTRHDPSAFRAVMELAIELFERRAGRLPVAYRAGAYRIIDAHFPILRKLGITIDSSINPFKHSGVASWLRSRTQPFWVNGVLEIPISLRAWHNQGEWDLKQFVPQTPGPLQLPALDDTAGAAPAAPAMICCIAHSVSFLRRGIPRSDADVAEWNERWAQLVTPDEYALSCLKPGSPLWLFDAAEPALAANFENTLATLAARPGVEGITLADVATKYRDAWTERNVAVDPVAGYDPRSRRDAVLRTRTYSSGYLRRMEQVHGAPPTA